MAWSQSHYDSAIAMGLDAATASHIASRKRPGRALQRNYASHVSQHGTPGASAQVATPPPTPPPPIPAPEAVSLRPSTNTGIQRRRSRRDRLGITNRGVSSFSYRSQPMGGLGTGPSGSLGI